MTLLDDVDAVLAAIESDAAAEIQERVGRARERLREPLKIAFAGRVKAGKSTLLNAVVGESIAASDAAECTKFVTWYQHGTHPLAHVVTGAGERVQAMLRQTPDGFDVDLDPFDHDDIDRIEISYPSPSLDGLTLIDTPGISSISEAVSARSVSFLAPSSQDQGADVLIYLLRFLHESDRDFLEAFTDPTAHDDDPVRSIAVLSRADELGVGRSDAPMLASDVADDYRTRPSLRRRVGDVMAVSGLIALHAQQLTQQDFTTIQCVAGLPLDGQERLLLSADRFGSETDAGDQNARQSLLRRFGLGGVRAAVGAVRSGRVATATELSGYLAEWSGIEPLRSLIARRYAGRADVLKAARALDVARSLVESGSGDAVARSNLERLETNAYELDELRCLRSLARLGGSEVLQLTSVSAETLERALGGEGVDLASRTGTPAVGDDSGADAGVFDAAVEVIGRLRAAEHAPLVSRDGRRLLSAAIRSLESALHTARDA